MHQNIDMRVEGGKALRKMASSFIELGTKLAEIADAFDSNQPREVVALLPELVSAVKHVKDVKHLLGELI